MSSYLRDLPRAEARQRIRRRALRLRFGPFVVQLWSPLGAFAEQAVSLYQPYEIAGADELVDFHVDIASPWHRRAWRPQAQFMVDHYAPYLPMPGAQALPTFEWGLNWCIAMRMHQYVMFHAGVLARGEHALILPGIPGAGKSTLTAALSQSGWRLLSDEFTLLRPSDMRVAPLPRPISLKNRSVPIIKAFSASANFGPVFENTHKGDVSHLVPPDAHIADARVLASPRWIVFPKFEADAPTELLPMSRGKSFLAMCQNSFNYEVTGEHGFRVVDHLTSHCSLSVLRYSSLDEAIAMMAALP